MAMDEPAMPIGVMGVRKAIDADTITTTRLIVLPTLCGEEGSREEVEQGGGRWRGRKEEGGRRKGGGEREGREGRRRGRKGGAWVVGERVGKEGRERGKGERLSQRERERGSGLRKQGDWRGDHAKDEEGHFVVGVVQQPRDAHHL
eukprot:3078014-Rhodomonas_salina.1